VAGQFALFGAVVLAPRVGPPLPWAVARLLRLPGAILLGAGGALMLRGVVDLGASFTPLPRPKDTAALVRDGVYARVRHPI
jgi:protein-S-isoprenylcysteine O-methyltransferase Ste14